ncbi:MAG: 50S ribosomal protein L7/L12 [bacterium TMED161]|jgi:large subunit ribosomal protein L7/L12|nr:MAG: 50S ribosomal protein L7/L12 [bacterium TMED161]|tara:strand:+ start:2702 stop:3085 length:384 start_codon:yes stop_codon:yes gene_type:complete
MAKLKKEDVLDYLESASMLEVSELISDIEEKFGVSAAAPVAVAAAPAAGGDGAAAEAKSEFNVELTGVGEKKINVIKVIREITSLGLKEAKDLADGAPSVIKEAVAADEANEMKSKLEEAGASVTLK